MNCPYKTRKQIVLSVSAGWMYYVQLCVRDIPSRAAWADPAPLNKTGGSPTEGPSVGRITSWRAVRSETALQLDQHSCRKENKPTERELLFEFSCFLSVHCCCIALSVFSSSTTGQERRRRAVAAARILFFSRVHIPAVLLVIFVEQDVTVYTADHL